MKRLTYALLITVIAPAFACGGDDGNGNADAAPMLPNEGFVPPTEITMAYSPGENDGEWNLIGPADWSCLNTPTSDAPSTVAINLTGELVDFQNDTELPDAIITAYDDTNFSGAGIATAVADEDGMYAMTLPVGQTRVAFKLQDDRALDTYNLNEYFEPSNADQDFEVRSVSLLTANALPAFIGVTRTVGLGILAGTAIDCNGDEVGGAIATVSSVSASPEHLDGAGTYYFSANATSLPVRHTQQLQTNTDGVFVVIELPIMPTAFLQVWGFIDGQNPATDELTLLAEIPAPILADSVVIGNPEPLRSN